MADFIFKYRGNRYTISSDAKSENIVIEFPGGTRLLVNDWVEGGQVPEPRGSSIKRADAHNYSRYHARRL
jgi:hypothetical protein